MTTRWDKENCDRGDVTKHASSESSHAVFDRTMRWFVSLPPPDRRWQAALDLAAEPRSAKRRSANADLAKAAKYLRATADCATDAEPENHRGEVAGNP